MLDFLEFLRLSIPSHQIQQKLPEHLRNHSLRHSIFKKKNVLCRIKPGQLFEQNPWTPTTLKKWQGVTGHLLTWVAIFVVLFHGLRPQKIWYLRYGEQNWIEALRFEVFSEGLGVYFWNIWLIERTNKPSWFLNMMEIFKGWTQDFWLIFLRPRKFG